MESKEPTNKPLKKGKTLLLFDIDGTLTAARQSIKQNMIDCLKKASTYEDIDLSGYYMTDKAEKPTKAKIAGGNTVVRSGNYAIMVLSGNSVVISTKYPHLNFRLSKEGGETVYLMSKDGKTVLDKILVPALDADVTYGRIPDGSGDFKVIKNPTPGKAN